jgi:hypothetical protein
VVPRDPAPVLYVDHFAERSVDLFRAVCEMDLEGIAAKRKDGRYTPEETSWVKIKNRGYSQADGKTRVSSRNGLRRLCRTTPESSALWCDASGCGHPPRPLFQTRLLDLEGVDGMI